MHVSCVVGSPSNADLLLHEGCAPAAVPRSGRASTDNTDGLFGKTIQGQRLATLSTYHQLTPMSRRHHIYAMGGRGGDMLFKPRVQLSHNTPYRQ